MVNTERELRLVFGLDYYNILNIVVNTERLGPVAIITANYNILNIVVNTEPNSLYKVR